MKISLPIVMKMVFEHQDYRIFLKTTLADKAKKSPGYSLRSFSHKLGVSSSFLSEVLRGKKSLSVELAFKIAVKLELTETESQYFCLLAQLEHEKDPDFRKLLVKRLKEVNPNLKAHDVSVDLFRVIADWYHFTILEMTHLPGFNVQPSYIAKKTGISEFEAEAALERLLRLGLIEKTPGGRYQKAHTYLLAQSVVPDQAFRRFHQQILQKATESLMTQAPKSRISSTDILPMDSTYLPKIERLSQEFSAAVLRMAERSKIKDSVYALSLHFFNLTPSEEKTR